MSHDPVKTPSHYTVYPVEPIAITRHLNFCLGNAVKYVLRAPYKGGMEDCDKAIQYLFLENSAPQPPLYHFAYLDANSARKKLTEFLRGTDGDTLWQDISCWQAAFLDELGNYLRDQDFHYIQVNCGRHHTTAMVNSICELRRVISLRDTAGQIYEGMTGLPNRESDDE